MITFGAKVRFMPDVCRYPTAAFFSLSPESLHVKGGLSQSHTLFGGSCNRFLPSMSLWLAPSLLSTSIATNSETQMSEWQLKSAECWWIFTLKIFSHKDYCNLLYAAFFAGLKWMRWDDKYKCAERKKGWFFTLKASIIPLQGMYFCISPSR